MLRKIAVALVAATMFTAPVFAQGTPAAAPAKSNTPAAAAPANTAAPKVAATKPAQKVVKHVKKGRHFAHVRHFKRVKHVKHARHHKRMPSTDARGGMQTSVKPRSTTN